MATLTKSLLPISGYSDQYYTYQCVITENSYNVATNTSNVTIAFSIKGPWAPSFYEWTTYYGIIVDGSVKKTGSSAPYISTSYVQLLSWTGDITHNSDGAKSINVGVYLYQSGPSNYLPKQYTSSSPLSMGSAALTTIPRASSFGTISGNTIGSSMTVNINRSSSSFTHQLWYKLGSSSWYDLGTGIGTQKAFTISNDLLSQLPSATSGTLQLCLRTYNGSTQIGSDVYKNVTVYVADSVVPTVGTITLDPADINGQNLLIQSKNKLTIKVSGCSAGTGSSIKSYTFSGPGISTTTTSTSTTSASTISNTGTLTYTVKVTDNRGRTASKNATITCYAYSAPYVRPFSAYRCNASGVADENGTYVKCNYTLGYSSVNGTNNVTVKILYKKNSASSYSSVTSLTNSTATSGSQTLSSIDIASTYTIYATITDKYGGSAQSSTATIFSLSRVINITQDGTGIALGKISEKTNSNTNGLFECKWDAKFYGTATGPSGFSTSSDERVKKNIEDINVDIVDGLRPIQYELSNIDDGKTHYGFIAQEVVSLLDDAGLNPETTGIVGYIMNNGRQEYVLTYTEFVPLLTKKCQDLQHEVNTLKQEIEELKQYIVK